MSRKCPREPIREVRRFVAGFDGEQYALPEAVEMPSSDPLHYRGVLTPEPKAQTA